MSSNEDETKAASVLSQMSKSTKQASENVTTQQIDNNSVIAHQCDVETTTNQEITPLAVDETLAASTPVSVKVYPCEYCGKVFNKSYNLKTHHRVHSGERPYQCAVCGHGFANLGDLKRHDRTHTGEKPYTCEYCNKCFSDFGSHKRHLRLHTGYKPFKCEKCDREFTRLDSYKNHVRLHTGVRPYKCEECQKEFNYLTTYKRHQNIHSGERPYSCDQCGRKFTRLIYVRNHQQNNCGKQKGKKTQTSNEEVVTSSDTTVVAMGDVSALGEALKLADNSVIENIAHDLSMQGGVQLNVTNVIYSNGEAQPFLIESGETTSHTLILTTNPEDRQQLLELAGANNKANISPITSDSPGTMFLTHSLPTPTAVSESEEQHGAVVTVKQEEHRENTELGCEVETGEESQLDGKSTEITSEDQEGCNLDPNAMYIAIDPTQRIIGDICTSVNSES